jgi:hypothetical protein
MFESLLNPGSNYRERISEAVIETPDRKRHTFQYGDLEKNIEKKTSKYRFGDVEGSYVQDFGVGETSFPLTMYFSGKDCDTDAKNFEKSASKKGVCKLDHPVYGLKKVIIESIKRQDNLKTASGQVIFTLTLTETIIFKIPQQDPNLGLGLLGALQALVDSITTAFNNSFLGQFVNAVIDAANTITAIVNDIVASIEFIASGIDGLTSAIYDIQRFITDNMSALLEAPFTLAGAINSLIQAPGNAIDNIESIYDMYMNMYDGVTSQSSPSAPASGAAVNTPISANNAAINTMVVSSIVGAVCNSAINTSPETSGLTTRSDAINFAVKIMDFYYEAQEYMDSLQELNENNSLEYSFVVDSQLTYNLKNVVALTVQNLVSLAFSLKQERIIYTEKEYNLFELSYKLYGSSKDEYIQAIIDNNELSGTDILMIPQDREIKYYV